MSSFGSVRAVVRAHDARLRGCPAAVLRDVVMAAWRLGAIGVAVGASGLIAWVMNAGFGRGFVGGARAAITVPGGQLPHWLAGPARAQLRAGRGAGEQQRRGVAAAGRGVLGLAALACYHLAPRRSRDLLPDSFTPTVAMTLFGAAGRGPGRLAASRLGIAWTAPAGTSAARSWRWSWPRVCARPAPQHPAASPWLSFFTARNEPPAGGRPAARDPPRAPRAGPGHPGR